MNVTVSVTPADIRKGKRARVTECPVALAASRVRLEGADRASAAPDRYRASAGNWNLWWHKHQSDCAIYRGTLPEEAHAWIRAFDAQKDVEPFTFSLDVVEYEERPDYERDD